MAEVYRKFGRTLRYENGVYVRVDEAGEAIEDGERFECHPIERGVELPEVSGFADAVRTITNAVKPPLTLERLVVTRGVAEHQFGGRTWRDEMHRVHASITYRSYRVMIDDVADVHAIVEALPRIGAERETTRIRLAPNVSAALLPALARIAPPNIRLQQMAGGIDGKGNDIGSCDVADAPNWYRPSYRVRPVRMPLNVRASCDVKDVDEDLPRAIALLGPIDRLVLHVLCTHREHVFPAVVRVSRIDAVADDARWYPYGAGSFGAEMML